LVVEYQVQVTSPLVPTLIVIVYNGKTPVFTKGKQWYASVDSSIPFSVAANNGSPCAVWLHAVRKLLKGATFKFYNYISVIYLSKFVTMFMGGW